MKFQNKKSKNKYILIFVLILNLIVGCNSTSGEIQIDMKSVGDAASAYDDAIPQIVQLEQKEKYERHYQNGLYYEDFSKENEELNKKFEQYWIKYSKKYAKENEINMENIPWYIKSDIEYIKSDLKKYKNKELKSEDIIINPNSIMSIKIEYHFFISEDDNDDSTSKNRYAVFKFRNELREVFKKNYEDKKVDFVNLIFQTHNIDILKKYSIQDLKKEENIILLEEKEGVLFNSLKK